MCVEWVLSDTVIVERLCNTIVYFTLPYSSLLPQHTQKLYKQGMFVPREVEKHLLRGRMRPPLQPSLFQPEVTPCFVQSRLQCWTPRIT